MVVSKQVWASWLGAVVVTAMLAVAIGQLAADTGRPQFAGACGYCV